MSKQLWLILISLASLTFTASLTFAGTFVEEFEGKEINPEVWRIYDHDPGGEIGVEDGALVTNTELQGWRQKGIMFKEPLNLTEGTTRFVVVYLEDFMYEEFPFGLWNDPDIQNADTWASPGMRLCVRGQVNGLEVVFQIGSVGEDFGDFGGVRLPIPSWPVTVEWILEPVGGKKFDITVSLNDGEEEGSCEVTEADLGNFDPAAECYFYLYYTNNTGKGEARIDRVVIENPAVTGNAAVSPKGKLSMMWASLKKIID